jgi:predicted enzyme related to lactoylglutathione lyase
MHKSLLGGLVIDCKTDDLEAAVQFWSQALGRQPLPTKRPEEAHYVKLACGPNELDIEVQKVDHPSRVHLDIETDDIEAEATRLEKLGAKRVKKIREWLVMEAPTGQRFCLVPPSRAGFDAEANAWK